jgi:hypothetical protein
MGVRVVTSDPMIPVTFEIPLSILREWRRRNELHRGSFKLWARSNHAPDRVTGAAKLALLDVELPPELPEVGRNIRLRSSQSGCTDRVGVVLAVDDGEWVWLKQDGKGPITYGLGAGGWSWEYM